MKGLIPDNYTILKSCFIVSCLSFQSIVDKHVFYLRHLPPLLPGKRTDSARADEPPAKRIKLEPTDMFKEEDVTSLPKPSLVYQFQVGR